MKRNDAINYIELLAISGVWCKFIVSIHGLKQRTNLHMSARGSTERMGTPWMMIWSHCMITEYWETRVKSGYISSKTYLYQISMYKPYQYLVKCPYA